MAHRTTHTLQFYCRSSKANKQGLSCIEASLIINGKRVFINLPRKEQPSVYKKAVDSKRQNEIKEYLDEVRRKFNSIELDMMRNNISLTADSVREYFKNGGVKSMTVGDLFDEYLDILNKRVGKDLTHSAYKKYQNAFDCFVKFCPRNTELLAITPAIAEKFMVDCQSKYQASTVCGLLTKIKTAFSFAKDDNKIQINPFNRLKYSRGKKDITYLTESEIKAIYNLKIDNKSLSDVRDCFILQASTGLSFADLYKLAKEDIHIDSDGTHYIVKNRQKTGSQFTTVVLPMGVEVLKKHDYQLHIISNQKYNFLLKTIQQLTGIQTIITSHLARRSFATLCLNKGVRLETVSKMLSHSSVKITQSYYAKLLPTTIVEEVREKCF